MPENLFGSNDSANDIIDGIVLSNKEEFTKSSNTNGINTKRKIVYFFKS